MHNKLCMLLSFQPNNSSIHPDYLFRSLRFRVPDDEMFVLLSYLGSIVRTRERTIGRRGDMKKRSARQTTAVGKTATRHRLRAGMSQQTQGFGF